MQKTFSIILGLVFALAACSTGPTPTPDWCYTFDFTASDFGATVTNGQWLGGQGFTTDGNGLSLTYTHTSLVQASYIEANVNVLSGQGIPFTLNTSVFGIQQNIADNIPSTGSNTISANATNAGSASTQIVLDLQTSSDVRVTSLRVEGLGANPFPTNSCAPAPPPTATPQSLPTQTATATATATNTPTPTSTPIPEPEFYIYRMFDWQPEDTGPQSNSGTVAFTTYAFGPDIPQDAEIHGFIMEYSDDGFNIRHSGYISRNGSGEKEIGRISAGDPANYFGCYQVDYRLQAEAGCDEVLPLLRDELGDQGAFYRDSEDVRFEQQDPFTAADNPIFRQDVTMVFNQGDWRFRTFRYWVILKGQPQVSTPPPTPTPTIIPTSTPIPPIDEQCVLSNWNFEDGDTDWTTTNTTTAPGAIRVVDGATLSQSFDLAQGGDYYLTIVGSMDDPGSAEDDGLYNFSYDIAGQTGGAGAPEAAIFDAGGAVYQSIPVAVNAGTELTANISFSLTAIARLNISAICLSSRPYEEVLQDPGTGGSDDQGQDNGVGGPPVVTPDGGGSWQQCGDIITPPSSLLDIGGWLRFLWQNLDKSFQCLIVPQFQFLGEILGSLLQPLLDYMGFIWALFLQSLEFIISWMRNLVLILLWAVANAFISGNNEIRSAFETGQYWIEAIIKLVGDMLRYLEIALDLVGLAINRAGRLLGYYRESIPTPPPGLHDCVTEPLEHNVCAVFYIMEWTVLYGPMGGRIIPLLVAMMGVGTVMFAVNQIRRIVLRTRGRLK